MAFAFAFTHSAPAQDAAAAAIGERPAEAVQDNSFLIEEAYNQEPGVVQHILTIAPSFTRSAGANEREWAFSFTQEWPVFSQAHQLSYTIPYADLRGDGSSERGFSDVLLNYRYQLLSETGYQPAVAPRISIILPTGSSGSGLGNGTVGWQFNLPASKIVSDRWTLHANAGATFFPDVRGTDLWSYTAGASAIYAVTPALNLMLECIVSRDEESAGERRRERSTSVYLSPGFRYAFNHPGDAQTVIGLATPFGLTGDSADFGLFIYASFEHFFYRPRTRASAK